MGSCENILRYAVRVGIFLERYARKIQKTFQKKLEKTAEKVMKHAKNLKPTFKVKSMYKMFEKLHKNDKMWEIDNEYWKKYR